MIIVLRLKNEMYSKNKMDVPVKYRETSIYVA